MRPTPKSVKIAISGWTLIKHFLKHYSQVSGKDIKTVSTEALKIMQGYSWPGNVRQLENAIESAIAVCDGNMIKISDLPFELTDPPTEKSSDLLDYQGSLTEVVALFEKQIIYKALEQNEWVQAYAAEKLGISERVMSYKIKKYGIVKKGRSVEQIS
ncbi:MAG: hypothetical protein COX16_16730 [Deltaproteobacteria bacterium CG23_combo_of_CG06-09_8_20_14_all_51_20]|nr:hypothetical protein [Deltaproteobacteria bacterium]PIP44772.1 MAG: hypothetical protein COX16_16730 [Deltaproteobacteria bacterium CG23_combo_of_CG06-09_8_20_14_all_51_20]PJB37505.1 MAG: hypothetical protein CO107_04680 [Deltaproteobacteria bacterium CG_4_9_14_3_um_filter_51_14]